MDSTTVLAACDNLIGSIGSTTQALKYPYIPVTEYLRNKDIQLFKDELEKLRLTLLQLGSRHLPFPNELITQLVSVLDDCDTIRQQSYSLLERNQGNHALNECKNLGHSWKCSHRDEAFMLRHCLLQRRAVLETALVVANLMSLKVIVRTVKFSKRALDDVEDQLRALNKSLVQVVGEDFQVPNYSPVRGQKVEGPLHLRRSLVAMRAALHAPRDTGITTPAPGLLMFLDRLLALAINEDRSCGF